MAFVLQKCFIILIAEIKTLDTTAVIAKVLIYSPVENGSYLGNREITKLSAIQFL